MRRSRERKKNHQREIYIYTKKKKNRADRKTERNKRAREGEEDPCLR